ncbi:Electron transfer flavoprotein subunit beta [Planctomycetes bacterium Poly30]|uniref:Electron transfer flavoprotein subunit beta n=1 Tax=Saltatorellus ferox TaxID=2528018 RepID=A0A518EN06_9BACT|nr:Electron transfer flavoprotein subunit beta [Planctomycetes bacterium Poly30]
MNIVACVKRVPTTEAVAQPTADGKGLDSAGLQYMISFYDEIAVEEAVKTKEALGSGEVTVLTLGTKSGSKEIRECLAKGGDKAVVLVDEEWHSRDARATAKALTAQLQSMGAELVFMGRVATDRDNAAVGPMVATYLGWPCITDVISLEISGTSGTAKVETEHGVETVSFSCPAVITCQKGLNEPRYAGLKGIMAAKKKPYEEVEVSLEANQAVPVEVTLPAPRKEGRIVGEGVAAIPALIDALKNEAQVL